MTGIVVAQFFRVQHSSKPNPYFGYFVLGIPLGCLCQAVACAVAIIGAHRYWRQQNALVRGKVRAGGWEISAVGIAILLVGQMDTAGNRILADRGSSSRWHYLVF